MKTKLALLILVLTMSDLVHALYGAKALTHSIDYSAVVTLHLSDKNKPQYDFFCSGVLIAPDKILTTGHCIEVMGTEVYEQWSYFSYNPEHIKVKARGIKYQVADVILAPSYTEAVGFEGEDLAIIRLKKTLKNIKPFKIAPKHFLKAGASVTMVARGKMATTTIKAQKSYAGNTVLFTEGSKSGLCGGDSGGALLVKVGKEEMLAGILSAQEAGCAKKTGVAIYAREFKDE